MTIFEMIKQVEKATTLKTVEKYANNAGVKLGNIKNIDKAKNKVINGLMNEGKNVAEEMGAYRVRAYNKAIERYNKKAMEHNEKASKMVQYAMKKLGKNTKDVRHYLQGYELDLSQRSNITYQRANSPFAEEEPEKMVFSDLKSINRRIRQLENMDKELTPSKIIKSMINNPRSKKDFQEKLKGFVDSGIMPDSDKNKLLKQFSKMNGLQQEILINNVTNYMPDKYLYTNDDKEELEVNLFNKLSDEIRTISTYL